MTTPVKKRATKAPVSDPARTSDVVKIAIITAITIVSVTGILTYFSPYQTCVRGENARNFIGLEMQCARALGRRR